MPMLLIVLLLSLSIATVPVWAQLLSRTLDGRHTLKGPSAAGMLPSSVQGGIHSVSLQGMSAI